MEWVMLSLFVIVVAVYACFYMQERLGKKVQRWFEDDYRSMAEGIGQSVVSGGSMLSSFLMNQPRRGGPDEMLHGRKYAEVMTCLFLVGVTGLGVALRHAGGYGLETVLMLGAFALVGVHVIAYDERWQIIPSHWIKGLGVFVLILQLAHDSGAAERTLLPTLEKGVAAGIAMVATLYLAAGVVGAWKRLDIAEVLGDADYAYIVVLGLMAGEDLEIMMGAAVGVTLLLAYIKKQRKLAFGAGLTFGLLAHMYWRVLF